MREALLHLSGFFVFSNTEIEAFIRRRDRRSRRMTGPRELHHRFISMAHYTRNRQKHLAWRLI